MKKGTIVAIFGFIFLLAFIVLAAGDFRPKANIDLQNRHSIIQGTNISAFLVNGTNLTFLESRIWNLTIIGNITLSGVVSCSEALETDAQGIIFCGTDDTGGGGGNHDGNVSSICEDGETLLGEDVTFCVNLNETIKFLDTNFTANIFDQNLNTTSNVTFINITSDGFFRGNGTFIDSIDCNNIAGSDSDFCVDDTGAGGGNHDGNVSSICSDEEILLGEDVTLCVNFNATIDGRINISTSSWWGYNSTTLTNQTNGNLSVNYDFLLNTIQLQFTNIFDQNLNVTDNATFINVTATGFFGGNGTFINSIDCNNIVGEDSDFCNDATGAGGGNHDGNVSSICLGEEVLLGEDVTLCVNLNATVDGRINLSSSSWWGINLTTLSNQTDGNLSIDYTFLLTTIQLQKTNFFDQSLNVTDNATFINVTATGFFAGNGTFINSLDCNNIVGADADFCVDANDGGGNHDGNVSSICSDEETLLGEDSTLCVSFNGTIDGRINVSASSWWGYNLTTLTNQTNGNLSINYDFLLTTIQFQKSNLFDQDLNTTDNVTFINITSEGFFRGNGTHIDSLDCNNIVGADSDFCNDDTGAGGGNHDGNVSSICADGEVLLGEDVTFCVNFNETIKDFDTNITDTTIADTNASTECSGDEALLGNGTCASTANFPGIGDGFEPDTNATTECADGEYLDGEGACFNFNITVDGRINVSASSWWGYNSTTLTNQTNGNISVNYDFLINTIQLSLINIFNQDLNTTNNVTFINITADGFFRGNGTLIDSIDCNNIVGEDSDFCNDDTGGGNHDGNVSSICSDEEVLLGEDTTLCVPFNNTIDGRINVSASSWWGYNLTTLTNQTNGNLSINYNFFTSTFALLGNIFDFDTNLTESEVEGFIFDEGNNITGSFTFNATEEINITKGDAGFFANDTCTWIRGLTSIIRAC